jgi:hypothetical protein
VASALLRDRVAVKHGQLVLSVPAELIVFGRKYGK